MMKIVGKPLGGRGSGPNPAGGAPPDLLAGGERVAAFPQEPPTPAVGLWHFGLAPQ